MSGLGHASTPLIFPAPRRVGYDAGRVTIGQDAWNVLTGGEWANIAAVVAAGRGVIDVRITGAPCGAGATRRDGYRLTVADRAGGSVLLESPTPAGARHGLATLRQLARQCSTTLPAMVIEDEPAFATRGVMLDVSRCRIPTMDEFRRVIDQIAELKGNHLQLYTEHTFAYAGHEEVWRGWDPITPDEVRVLEGWCREKGIELAANQNCFGHLHEWFRHARYAGLAETHGDWVFDVWPRKGPFSLCPTDPASLRFVEDLLGQLLPCFSCPLVNIGCDETYDIAYGRSADEVKRRGREAVYLDFVTRIADVVRAHAKRPMFWADIALSHPECARQIPEDMVCLAWGYEPDAPFDRWCEQLGAAGREVWVCPGTSAWRSITGRTTERRANIDAAARAGLAGGATAMLICDWGDTGHWQTWPIAMRGIGDGLNAAWRGPGAPDPVASSVHAPGRSDRLGRWLDAFGDLDRELREVCLPLSRPGVEGRLRNQSAIFIDLLKGWNDQREVGGVERWRNAAARAREALRDLATFEHDLDSRTMDEVAHAARLAEFAARRGTLRRTGGAPGPLREEWEGLAAAHARLWRLTSREGGLAQSLEFFKAVDVGAGPG